MDDFLSTFKKEIAEKKKKLPADKKFIKRSEYEKLREKEYFENQRKLEFDREKKKRNANEIQEHDSTPINEISKTRRVEKSTNILKDPDMNPKTGPSESISVVEVKKRLRYHKQPITLFGESDQERWKRLKEVETKLEKSGGQRNAYLNIVSEVNEKSELETLKNESGLALQSSEKELDFVEARKLQVFKKYESQMKDISQDLCIKDSELCYTLIYVYLKRIIKDWEQFLDARDGNEKVSDEGRKETILFKQTVDYMKPFFKGLKKNSLENDVFQSLAEICHWIYRREYIKANDAYLRLAIGNACWPIGVTGVNIHERSALDRITTGQVAHALNDESTRKWIQCIKRLITVAQKIKPPEDPTKIVL